MNQKYMLQIIRAENGSRSEPFLATWDQAAEALELQEEAKDEDYILLVAIIDPEDEKNMVIPKTPLISIKTFLQIYSDRKTAA